MSPPGVGLHPRRVLVLCPHTDDELWCAGTLARFIEGGASVHYVALSRCEESVPDGLPSDTLEKECRGALASLGCAPGSIEVWDLPVRRFPERRQEVLERFVRLRGAIRPDLVLCPSTEDVHQDHATVAAEAVRAFKHTSLLGYEAPQNNFSFATGVFVKLSEANVTAKVRAIAEYRSQSFRPYASEEFIRSLARVRGVQVGAEYAEAFQALRLVIE